MLLRILFVVIACGVLAVSRVMIVQGDHQAPSILSLLPLPFGLSGSSSSSSSSSTSLHASSSHKRSHRRGAAGVDDIDAAGARGLQAFRKSLRSRLGVYAGKAKNFKQRISDIRMPRLRRRGVAGDGSNANNIGPGQFAERLLRQLVNRAHQLGEASFGAGINLGAMDERYLSLIRALEVEGEKALGPDDWR